MNINYITEIKTPRAAACKELIKNIISDLDIFFQLGPAPEVHIIYCDTKNPDFLAFEKDNIIEVREKNPDPNTIEYYEVKKSLYFTTFMFNLSYTEFIRKIIHEVFHIIDSDNNLYTDTRKQYLGTEEYKEKHNYFDFELAANMYSQQVLEYILNVPPAVPNYCQIKKPIGSSREEIKADIKKLIEPFKDLKKPRGTQEEKEYISYIKGIKEKINNLYFEKFNKIKSM